MVNDAKQNGGGGEVPYQRLLEEAPEVVMVLGPDLMVRYASAAVRRTLGFDPRDVAGSPSSAQKHGHLGPGKPRS